MGREALAHLARAVGRLPGDYRAAFLLRVEENLSFREIAVALGITEETDAVAIVISEQEGTAALVIGGNVTENIDRARLRSALQDLVKG